MPRRTRELPALDKPFSRPRAPLSSGAGGQPGITRHGSAVAQVTVDVVHGHQQLSLFNAITTVNRTGFPGGKFV
jgi:hypothetical protein